MKQKLILLFGIAVVVATFFTWNYPKIYSDDGMVPIDMGDERLYMSVSRNFYLGSPYPKNDDPAFKEFHGFYMRKPPVYFYLCSLSFRLLGPFVSSARLVSLIFSCLSLILLYFFSSFYLRSYDRLIPPALLSFVPLYSYYSHVAVLDQTFVFFAALALFFYELFLRRKSRPLLFLGAVSLGIATATKQLGAIVGLAILAHYIIANAKLDRENIRVKKQALENAFLFSFIAVVVFLFVAPSFFMHPLLSLKHLIWLEYVSVIRAALLHIMPNQFNPAECPGFLWDILFIVVGYVGLYRAHRLKWAAGSPLTYGVVFFSFSLFFGRLHYVLLLLFMLSIFIGGLLTELAGFVAVLT